MKPVIGITSSPTEDVRPWTTFQKQAVSDDYIDAVVAAGGVPILLPSLAAEVARYLDLVDGLLLTGGADFDPARFGEREVHPTTYGIDERRDAFEIDLIRGAIERDIPVFGICRGIQALNVALGGTLVQDIPSQYPVQMDIAHRQYETGHAPHEPSHPVVLSPSGIADDIFSGARIDVNSFHHQAIATLAPELRSVATAPEGFVEAVCHAGPPWALGVQWHPEMMFKHHPEHLRPFQALVEAAAARRLVSSPV
ncbi:MAG TPA: gamma-glutamyl-gamma-aminobutyrate hydrolase family protein [Thermomicrobiales bacterium]|nr:gamma-glutamyl-gamma-aminobutyrate hydrolase family protein [Thermomicrobiales bacterium]